MKNDYTGQILKLGLKFTLFPSRIPAASSFL